MFVFGKGRLRTESIVLLLGHHARVTERVMSRGGRHSIAVMTLNSYISQAFSMLIYELIIKKAVFKRFHDSR